MRTGPRRGIAGAVIGAIPGVILILLAEFVIEGEAQLSVGAPGIMLAAAGAVAGFVIGLRSGRRRT